MRKLLMTGVAVATLPVMSRPAAAWKAAARTVTGAAVGRDRWCECGRNQERRRRRRRAINEQRWPAMRARKCLISAAGKPPFARKSAAEPHRSRYEQAPGKAPRLLFKPARINLK
ncbi:MAG: hypothetical protein F9K38_03905 [Pseudorhodoplanes sp.]|nr:MAG: hypothetical protein F9K38_03905 [Pseudorhodoplanes sp.]